MKIAGVSFEFSDAGTLTNQITPKYLEPRLLIVTDPRTDQQAIKEAPGSGRFDEVIICDHGILGVDCTGETAGSWEGDGAKWLRIVVVVVAAYIDKIEQDKTYNCNG